MGKHIIVGAGQVGGGLATLLAEQGHEVVVVSRSGSGPTGVEGVETIAANVADPGKLTEIAKGADAIYNCANPPYHRWVQEWPPMAAALLAAAEDTGAVLVTLNNLYGYGPVERPMTEDLPMASTGSKGQVRAKMWADALAAHKAGRIRMTEVRASDYYGPGSSDQSFLGDRFLKPLLAGKRATFLSDPGVPHSWTYLPDVARAMAIAGTDERAWGRAWHVPTGPAVSPRAVGDRLVSLAGAPAAKISRLPGPVLHAMGWVNPLMREMRETRYQFDRPFILDSSDFETTFGMKSTPMDEALTETLAWHRRKSAGSN